jgi:hypothetical protein
MGALTALLPLLLMGGQSVLNGINMQQMMPLMLMSGGKGMSQMLPLLLMSGSSGLNMQDPMMMMMMMTAMKPQRRYRRRGYSTSNKLAYYRGLAAANRFR